MSAENNKMNIVAMVVKKTGLDANDINGRINFVKTGVMKRGWAILEDWIKVGDMLLIIKRECTKKEFLPMVDELFNEKLNKNDRAYSMRLAEQKREVLKDWYHAEHITNASPQYVFNNFCESEPGEAVNPPKAKKPVVNPSPAEPRDTEATTALIVKQNFTTYAMCRDKAQEAGNLTAEDLTVLKAELEKELDAISSALELELKAA